MKPFNLEEAKAGNAVCTGNGMSARIIGYDAKGCRPITALVKRTSGGELIEVAENYWEDGTNALPHIEEEYQVKKISDDHLYMKTTKEKRFCLFSSLFGSIYNGQSFSSLEDAQYKLRSLENAVHQSGEKYQIIEFEVEV